MGNDVVWSPPEGDDAAWLVGIYEGEGCATWCHHHKGHAPSDRYGNPYLSLMMTDLDVMERAAALLGGKLCTSQHSALRKDGTPRKLCHYLRFGGETAVVRMRWLRSFVGERRGAQIDSCLTKWEARPNKRPFRGARLSKALSKEV